jgi:GcrA cell cycle regulator
MASWPPEASERLVELYDEGRSASVIAELLHREGLISVTRNGVIGRAHRLKLPARAPRKPARMTVEQRRVQDAARKRLKRALMKKVKPMMDEATREKLRCETVSPLHISIYELTDDTCRFPYGTRAPYSYCGRPTIFGSSYCEHHDALCGVHPRVKL